MSESADVEGYLEYLKLRRIYAFRINAGGRIRVQGEHKARSIALAPKGTSDILGILPGGRFLAIEAKVGRNKLRPAQEEFLKWVNNAGGLGLVVRSLEQLITAIDKALLPPAGKVMRDEIKQ